MTPDDVAALKAEYDERTHILHLHYTGRRVLSGTQLEEAETLHWDIQCAYIAALEADRDHWQLRALAAEKAVNGIDMLSPLEALTRLYELKRALAANTEAHE